MFSFSKELINELKNKNENAFNQFYSESIDIFYRYLKGNFTISDTDAQDLISTLYLKIRNGLENYKENSTFSSWVWTIFRNLTLDYFKQDKYTAFSELNNEDEGKNFEESIESDENILNSIETSYKYQQILNAIEKMEDIYKEVIHLRFIEDLSYDEISDLIGVSNENIRKRLSRAIKVLKDSLGNV